MASELPFDYKWIGSPNFTKGRSRKLSYIVLHWMNGTLKSTDAHFKNKSSGVSAQYGVEDNKVHQYVSESDTAWHAISANPYSIGIEISAAPGRAPSAKTYETVSELVARICIERGWNVDKVLFPHCKFVATRCPGTDQNGKVDEKGGVDFAKIRKLAKQYMADKKPVIKKAKSTKKKWPGVYLHRGSSGKHVDWVHRKLHKIGLYNAAFDKHFGPLTEKAVKKFQRKKKLVPDGWVGPITWAALNNI